MNMTVAAVVFPGFELLDLYGPLEMLGTLKRVAARGLIDTAPEIRIVAQSSEPVASDQGPRSAVDATFADQAPCDILLIPGGPGTRPGMKDPALLDWIGARSDAARYTATVCTGSLLLAATGRLDGRRATTNKMVFNRETPGFPKVDWVPRARWVEDGAIFTSSGVSAGMDMTLALIARLYGAEAARQAALISEYDWHEDPARDPFAEIHGVA